MKISNFFWGKESYSRGIVWSTVVTVLSQVLGFVGNVYIAFLFGTRTEVDVYYYCVGMAFLFAAFFANIEVSVIIPEAMRLEERDLGEKAARLLNFFLYAFACIGAVIFLPGVLAPKWLGSLISRFDKGVLFEHGHMIGWASTFLGLTILGQYLSDIIVSKRHFTAGAFSAMLPKIGTLCFLVAGHRQMGIAAALAGACLGAAMQIVSLLVLMRFRMGWDFRADTSSVSFKILRNMGFSQVGHLVGTFAGWVPLFLLSSFPQGTLAAIGYAQRLSLLPAQLLIGPVSSVFGIKVNELRPKEQWHEIDRSFRLAWHGLFVIMMPLAAFMIVDGQNIVKALYQRGEFGPDSLKMVVIFFRIFAASIPLTVAVALTARLFFGWQKIVHGMICQVANRVMFVMLCFVGVKYFGGAGYPAAELVTAIFYQIVLYHAVSRLFSCIRYDIALQVAGRLALVSAGAAVPTWLFGRYFLFTNAWPVFVLDGTVFLISFFILALFSTSERGFLLGCLRRLLGDLSGVFRDMAKG